MFGSSKIKQTPKTPSSLGFMTPTTLSRANSTLRSSFSSQRRIIANEFDCLAKIIDDENIRELKSFMKDYPDEKYFLNCRNESIVSVALRKRKFEIYEYLILKNFNFHKDEIIDKVMKNVPKDMRKRVTDFNIAHGIIAAPDYIETLRRKTHLRSNWTEEEKKKLLPYIIKAYIDLSSIELVKPILEIIASAVNLRIIFDFDDDASSKVDTFNCCQLTGGVAFASGEIVIGTKFLLKDESSRRYYEGLGAISHEFCHYAMLLIYGNDFEPYFRRNDAKKRNFLKILSFCKANQEKEKLIKLVFGFNEADQAGELITRVPQFFTIHHHSKHEKDRFRELYPSLLSFYTKYTIDDLKRELPKLRSKNLINRDSGIFAEMEKTCRQVRSIDWKFEDFNRITVLSTNSASLTQNAIFHKFFDTDLASRLTQEHIKMSLILHSRFIFTHFDYFKSETNFKRVKRAFSLLVNPFIFVDCQNKSSYDVRDLIMDLKEQQLSSRITLLVDEHFFLGEPISMVNFQKVSYCFGDLSKRYLDDIMRRKLIFQDNELSTSYLENFIPREKLKNVKLPKNFIPENFMNFIIGSGVEIDKSKLKNYVERDYEFENCENLNHKDFKFWLKRGSGNSDEIKEHKKVFLLVNSPGMGKTMETMKMTLRFKEKFPNHWVIFIDLKKYCDIFDKQIEHRLESLEEVSRFLSFKILKLNDFEADIFDIFLRENRVILLFDSFDEIPQSSADNALGLMSIINNQTKNILWVASRPRVHDKIKEFLNVFIISLTNFSSDQRKIFVTSLLKNGEEKSSTERVSIEQNISNLETVFDRIGYSLGKINPMLISIIVEVFRDREMSVFDPKLNLFNIYEEFVVKALTKQMINEKLLLSFDLIRLLQEKCKIHEFYAMKSFLKTAKDNFEEFGFRVSENCLEEYFDDQIIKVINYSETKEHVQQIGLLSFENSEDFYSLHQTFRDFFIAKFLIDNFIEFRTLSEKDRDIFIQIITAIVLSDDSDLIVRFLKNHTLRYRKFNELIEIEKAFLLHYEDSNQEKIRNLSLIKYLFAKASSVIKKSSESQNFWDSGLFYILTLDLENFVEKFRSFVSPKNLQEFLSSTDEDQKNIFHHLFEAENSPSQDDDNESIKKNVSVLINEFKNSGYAKFLLLMKDRFGNSPLMYAVRNRRIEIFFQAFQGFLNTETVSKILDSTNERKFTVLHELFRSETTEILESILEILRDALKDDYSGVLKNVLIRRVEKRMNIFHLIFSIEKVDEKELEQRCLLLMHCIRDSEQIANLLTSKDDDGETPLIIAARNFHSYEIIFKIFQEMNDTEMFRELLQQRNKWQCSAIYYTIISANYKQVRETLLLTEMILGKDFSTFLVEVMKSGDNFRERNIFHDFFWKFDDQISFDEKCKILRLFIEKVNNRELIKEYFVSEDKNGDIPLHCAVDNPPAFECYIEIARDLLGREKCEKIFKNIFLNEFSSLQNNVALQSLKFFQSFFKTSREILGENFKIIMSECIMSKDQELRNIFHSAFENFLDNENEKLKVLKENKEILFETLTKKEINELLNSKDKYGMTPLMMAAQNSDSSTFSYFFEVFSEVLSSEVLWKLLTQKSNENLTAMHYLIINKKQDLDIFQFSWFEKLFGSNHKSTIEEILNPEFYGSFFHFIFSDSRVKITEKLTKICESLINECQTAEDVKRILISKDQRGNTCLALAASDRTSIKLKQFFSMFRKYLYKETLKEITKIRNSNFLTPLHCAILNQDIKSMKLSFEMFSEILSSEEFRNLMHSIFITEDEGREDIYSLIQNSSCEDKYKKLETMKIQLENRRFIRESSLEKERIVPRLSPSIVVDDKELRARSSLSPPILSPTLIERRSPLTFNEEQKIRSTRSSRSPQNFRENEENETFRNYLTHDYRTYKMKFNGNGM